MRRGARRGGQIVSRGERSARRALPARKRPRGRSRRRGRAR
ncbi:hypothetical protein ACFPRL_19755 [Pseudoclavibacter helvolus]